jgi:hypothetical protein
MPEMPAQTENRRWWILDVVREHQSTASGLLSAAMSEDYELCRQLLRGLHGNDRRALLQPEGILTDQQIDGIGYW